MVSGGAKLEEETELKLLGLGYDVVTGYGLSETAPVVTFNRPDRSRIGSAGEPLPGVGVRISQSKIDSLGEIEVRGPNVGQPLSLDMNPTLDLGLDSLDWMTITMELEQAFGIVLDQPTASLRDLVVIALRARQQTYPG